MTGHDPQTPGEDVHEPTGREHDRQRLRRLLLEGAASAHGSVLDDDAFDRLRQRNIPASMPEE